MKRTLKNGITRKEQTEMICQYLLEAVNRSDYFDFDITSDKQAVNAVMEDFENATNFPVNLHNFPNRQDRFADWLMGLPSSFNVDYENHRILALARAWGSLAKKATEREEDKILANWWKYIAAKFLQLHAKLNKN